MKLILEKWNKFLKESEYKRLSIFDFDHTIASATGFIIVTVKETGKQFKITTQEEYDKLKPNEELYDFDFSNLSQITDPQEIKPIVDILRKRVKDPQTQAIVLTARAPDAEDEIQTYLSTLEPTPIDTSEMYIIGCSGCNKGDFILKFLQERPSIVNVEFYDDSVENIDNMKAASQSEQAANIAFSIFKVTDGKITQVK